MVPQIKWNGLALMLDMYCVSFFSAALLYIYNDSTPVTGRVPLFGEGLTLYLMIGSLPSQTA